jgi:hypothetical protein
MMSENHLNTSTQPTTSQPAPLTQDPASQVIHPWATLMSLINEHKHSK